MPNDLFDNPAIDACFSAAADLQSAAGLCILWRNVPLGMRTLARYRARRRLAASCRKVEHALAGLRSAIGKLDPCDAQWFKRDAQRHIRLAEAIIWPDPLAISEASTNLSATEFPPLHEYLFAYVAFWGKSKSSRRAVASVWERVLADAETAGQNRRGIRILFLILCWLPHIRIELRPNTRRRLAALIAAWEKAGFPGAEMWKRSGNVERFLPKWYVANQSVRQ
jgi:hypothetical protein